jgi:hypothetical protein
MPADQLNEYDMFFPHDFKESGDIIKYNRRIDRFKHILETNSEPIYFIRKGHASHLHAEHSGRFINIKSDIDDAIEFDKLLQIKYPKLIYKIIIFLVCGRCFDVSVQYSSRNIEVINIVTPEANDTLLEKNLLEYFKGRLNIAFWTNGLCERGTTVAAYDYAHYNETILGNRSFIFYNKNLSVNKSSIIKKFTDRFPVHALNSFQEVDEYIKQYNISHIYIIKSGEKDNKVSKIAKNCIHAVFNYDPHGEIYAAISPSVNKYCPIVPHMINLPSHERNLREILSIPMNAVVFGSYGGATSFSIPYVQKIVYKVAKEYPNIYFLFANFNRFCPVLSNIIHMETIIDLEHKVEFINTCDAMLHARKDGETFGIAIGEFSSKNKRILTTHSGDSAHIEILKEKGLYYTEQNLEHKLLQFKPIEGDWNAYTEYSPEIVMTKFKHVFLS